MEFVENNVDVEGENVIVGGAGAGAGAGASAGASAGAEQKDPATVRLVDVEVTSEIVALNLLVSFLNLAQKRGAFSIDESAKIWECIKKFQRPG
jgi:hypothetical protein